mgnify:CR=1 FL=1
MSINIPDPEVECWDYSLNVTPMQRLWIARFASEENELAVITMNVNPMWRYLLVADTQEQLAEDIRSMHEGEIPELIYSPVSANEILDAWRLLRYNGRNVCVTESLDFTPVNPSAWPGGPMAPVRNGYAYTLISRDTNKPVSYALRGGKGTLTIPVVEPTINKLLNNVCGRDEDPVPMDQVFSEHYIVANNLLELAMQHPVVCWSGKVLPIYGIMALNPNHSGDPEELALATLDSTAQG